MIRILAAASVIATLAMPTLSFADDNSFFTSSDAASFYTGSDMKTMKNKEEMAAAFAKMTPDAQAKMKVACAATTDQSFSDMCQAAKASTN